MQHKIHEYLISHQEEMVDTLKQLVAFPSVRQTVSEEYPFGKECAEVLSFIEALYQKHGFATQMHDKDGYLLSYLGEGEPGIGLFAHADVVAPGDHWVVGAPFLAAEKDGFLIGRGVADDKCAVVAAIYIMKMIQELSLPVSSSIVSFTGIGEETGMQDVKNYIKQHKAPRFSLICDSELPLYRGNKGTLRATAISQTKLNDIIRFHGGASFNIVLGKAAAALPYSDARYQALKALETDAINVSCQDDVILVSAEGISTHGAFPEGSLNAGYQIADVLSRCNALSAEDQTQMEFVRDLLQAPYGEALGIASVDPDFGKLTCTNGIVRLEDGQLSLEFDIRYGCTTQPEQLKNDLISVFRDHNWSVSFSHCMPPHLIPEDLPVVQACLKVYREFRGDHTAKAQVNAGGTYGRYLPCAVEIGTMIKKKIPFPLPKGHGSLHQPDELLSISGFLEAVEITMQMILACDSLL